MTIQEFSTEFDVLYNNVTSNQAPGLNEYEKSVFLTKAQSQLVNEYFNNRTDGFGGGFDGSQKRQYDFSSLIRVEKLHDINAFKDRIDPSEKLDRRSKVFLFPQNFFLAVNEILSDAKWQYSVIPLSHAEYQRLMLKPYNFPVKRAAWRMLTDKKNGNFAHEVSTESGIGFNDLQISGNEQETVYRRRIALYLRVDNTRINIGQEGFALHKSVKFLVNRFISFTENLTDNIVATCGLPISTRLTIVAEVVDNRPGIKYLGITELISIVPRADLFVFIFCFIVLCHFLNFFGGKSKILAVFAVYNGVDGEVITARE